MKELNLEYFKKNKEYLYNNLSKTLSEKEIKNGIEILKIKKQNCSSDKTKEFYINNTVSKVLEILYTNEQIDILKRLSIVNECIYYADDDNVKITVENIPTSPYDEEEFIKFEYEDEYVYVNVFTHSVSFEDK